MVGLPIVESDGLVLKQSARRSTCGVGSIMNNENRIFSANIRKLLEEATIIHLEKRFDAAALREFDSEME